MKIGIKLDINQLLFSISLALDAVEEEVLGATQNHSKRVAYFSILIGEKLKFTKEELLDLTGFAILHDNALTEYITIQSQKGLSLKGMKQAGFESVEFHCEKGEENIKNFPFFQAQSKIIKYHHENYDGTGLYGLKGTQIPTMANIIHMVDNVDVILGLSDLKEENIKKVMDHIIKNKGKLYEPTIADIFLELLLEKGEIQIGDNEIDEIVYNITPDYKKFMSYEEIEGICKIFAHIIDYKSPFTLKHSIGIAEKTKKMAQYYKFEEEHLHQIYISALLHDIGKLVISNDILEKPGKLTEEEYEVIKKHVYYTWKILSKIDSFGTIAKWASSHHEKLNGTGYFRGSIEKELDFESKLLTCIDIYQALVEVRPYREGMPHEKAIFILTDMANRNEVDKKIVEDIDTVFCP